jgi:hypothetical protein
MLQSITSRNFFEDPHSGTSEDDLSLNYLPIYELTSIPGDFVVAAIKSGFYRGQVESVQMSKNICTVKLIDYGSKAELSRVRQPFHSYKSTSHQNLQF